MKLLTTLLGALVLAGLPLFVLILATAALVYTHAGLDLTLMFVEIFNRLTDNPIFLTIPLFAHAGYVLTESGAGKRLVELTHAALGWMPGGTAIVTVFACGIFTAFTGASGVTIVAMGGLLWPLLKDEGYRERYRLGLLTSCGSLGLLFPPSLPAIVLALVVSAMVPVGVKTLFTACLVPGIFLVLILSIHGVVVQLRERGATRDAFDTGRLLRALRAAAWELPIPFLVLFGIFGGWLTIVDAAALVCAACITVEVFIRREINSSDLKRITIRSMILVGAILIIVMAAFALSNVLTDQEVPQKILGLLEGVIESRLTFLIALNVFLLLVGCTMDIYSAILVVVPMLYPVAMRFGVDPVHLAVIILVNLEIGYLTPPVGINLFIASLRFARPVPVLYRASLPFIGLLLLCLCVVTWVPELSLGLLRLREQTGQVVLRVARRPGAGDSTGELFWARRADGISTDPDVFLEPAGQVTRQKSTTTRVHFEPETHRLRLSIASTGGSRLVGVWNCEGGSFEELSQVVLTADDLHQLEVAVDDPIVGPQLGDSIQVFGSELSIQTAARDRIKGAVHVTLLFFPDDPDSAEVVWDLWVSFDSAISESRVTPMPLPDTASEVIIDHVHGAWRQMSGVEGKGSLTLETKRSLPHDFRLQWHLPDTPDTAPLDEIRLPPGSVHFLVTRLEGLPGLSGELRVLSPTLSVKRLGDDHIDAVLRAVLSPVSGADLFDAEWRIDLPYHR